MKFSNRILNMQFSPIRKLSVFADAAQKRGLNVIKLNIGQPDIKTPPQFFEALKKINLETLSYCNSKGIDELIKSFVKYYKEHDIILDQSDILITNGGSEALQITLKTLCDPEENVLIPEPFYTNYSGFTSEINVKVNSFRTYAKDGFNLPCKDDIVNKIDENTRAILISNPSNPTGKVYSKDELKVLGEVAKEHDLFIITDEVYREFSYDNFKATSFMDFKDLSDRVILIDSISKRYSACGARIGLIASKNKDFINEATKLCQSRLCSPVLEQMAASNLINTPKEYFKEVLAEYQDRRDILYNELKKIEGITLYKPQGAFYIIVGLPIDNAEDFSKWLINDFSYNGETVLVAPANGFYSSKELGLNEIRISYCLNKDALLRGANILKLAVDKYNELKNK